MWWREGVVYQIYPRSFADATATASATSRASARTSTTCSLARRRRGLALADLPVADGRLRLRRRRLLRRRSGVRRPRGLRRAARRRRTRAGIRVLLDWVPNHTSDQHPWFVESRASRDRPEARLVPLARRRAGRRPPNNWRGGLRRRPGVDVRRGARSSGTCTRSCPSSPTSTGTTPRSSRRMHDVLRFWLDRGVDGFRVDVVHLIGKDPALADLPRALRRRPPRRRRHPRLPRHARAAARHPRACSTSTRASG